MTTAATIAAAEKTAHAIAAAIDADAALGGLAVDLSERAPGRWEVTVYFEAAPDAPARKALRGIAARFGGAFKIATLPATDWVAKSLAGLAPVRAGRFLIHGRHDRGRRKGNDIAIEIEAGLAFGTGHHGTTTGCLLAIDTIAKARPIRTALDLGTGSGVLAIALALRTGAAVTASDIDPVAVTVARENVRLNGVGGRVRVVTATGLRHPLLAASAPYDLVVANILAGPLVALAPAIRSVLAPGGVVVLSGILAGQARRVAAAYRGVGLAMRWRIVRGEWVTLVVGQ